MLLNDSHVNQVISYSVQHFVAALSMHTVVDEQGQRKLNSRFNTQTPNCCRNSSFFCWSPMQSKFVAQIPAIRVRFPKPVQIRDICNTGPFWPDQPEKYDLHINVKWETNYKDKHFTPPTYPLYWHIIPVPMKLDHQRNFCQWSQPPQPNWGDLPFPLTTHTPGLSCKAHVTWNLYLLLTCAKIL